MANRIREIKQKIQATKKTRQITKAMHMISAAKLNASEKAVGDFKAYHLALDEIVGNLVSNSEGDDLFLFSGNNVKRTCYLLVSSDRGLAGPFNGNVFKLLDQTIKKGDIVGALGTKGYFYCRYKKYSLLDEFVHLPDDVAFADVYKMLENVIRLFSEKKIGKVIIIYNHYINAFNVTPTLKQILPIDETSFKTGTKKIYDYEDGVPEILATVLPIYLESLIYGVILDSKAGEYASRMIAMKSATDNASEIIAKLELAYNRARQAAITAELTDIVGGAAMYGGN